MKSIMKKTIAIVFAVALVLGCTMANDAYAASGYKNIQIKGEGVYKCGEYYLENLHEKETLLVSDEKDGVFEKTPIPRKSFYSNGVNAFYVKNQTLYKYSFAKNKEVKKLDLSKLYESEDTNVVISAYYPGVLYFSVGEDLSGTYDTYLYNASKNTMKLIKKGAFIQSYKGKYAFVSTENPTDVSPIPEYVFQLKTTGFKKVKKLGSACGATTFVDKYIYYTVYPNKNTSKAILVKSTPAGTTKKKVATFDAGKKGEVVVYDVTAKKCTVRINGKDYSYNYKTKKKTRIK